ncbi:MAG: hypothetical protein AABW88_04615 [Nanoarchaeota archaeon]
MTDSIDDKFDREFFAELSEIVSSPFDISVFRNFIMKHKQSVSPETYGRLMNDDALIKERYDSFLENVRTNHISYWGELMPLLAAPFHAYRFRKFISSHHGTLLTPREYAYFERQDDKFLKIVYDGLKIRAKNMFNNMGMKGHSSAITSWEN